MSNDNPNPVAQAMVNRLAVKLGADAPWWWLSFADDDGFLGVAIVRGLDLGSASMAAHGEKCNPGGECLGFSIPQDMDVPERFQGRLLTQAEAKELDAHWKARKQ